MPLKILRYIWQLPQNLLALALIPLQKCVFCETYKNCRLYIFGSWGGGLCLGDYLFCGKDWLAGGSPDEFLKRHEYGHHLQSLFLGPLYLFVVGIPSVSRLLWDRHFHKHWSAEKSHAWYHGGFPENWANKLGTI